MKASQRVREGVKVMGGLYCLLRSRALSIGAKVTMMEHNEVPSVSYGSESWVVNAKTWSTQPLCSSHVVSCSLLLLVTPPLHVSKQL